jgi:hypothetical protein
MNGWASSHSPNLEEHLVPADIRMTGWGKTDSSASISALYDHFLEMIITAGRIPEMSRSSITVVQ